MTSQSCLSSEVRLRLEHELRGRKKFEDKCAMQAGWLKEKDAEIASLKAQLSLKEAEAAEAIRLQGQVAVVEAAEAARIAELNGLKEHAVALGGQLLLWSLKRMVLVVRFLLETTCSELREQVLGYELFKEHIEAVQDAQVKILSDKVAGIDADLMEMALHLDEEFYPHFLTIIAGRRWILS
ncbi:hypothetical protein Tco_0726752 [Tanacetum coccineum]|uniref:Uncharacterized protein n=1 Tax=Tanacetum coccineum TaxID=301880 RepID=A0ABQ4YHI8_9ASTR